MKRYLRLGCILLITLLLGGNQAPVRAEPPKIRFSTWYWLNAAPRSEWEKDFRSIRDLGFTHILLCWGLDLSAFRLRQTDSKRALELCQRAGLGAYLVIWHPTHNTLPRQPEFQQVDAAGKVRFSFDVFNPEWRRTHWKAYLQEIARTYRSERALAGYVLDDSFGIGAVGSLRGPQGDAKRRIISYGKVEEERFGGELPRDPSHPDWNRWMGARAQWWEEWAADTMKFLRAADPDPQHEVYIEDWEGVLGDEVREATGADFGRVARHFDAVGAYSAAAWDPPGAGERLAEHTRDLLKRTREVVGPDKKIVYTFWVFNRTEMEDRGVARYPTAEQIQKVTEAALEFGVRHVDLYGYRIGDWRVTDENWSRLRPGDPKDYPVLEAFPGKFLHDRPAIHGPLREYLHGRLATAVP